MQSLAAFFFVVLPWLNPFAPGPTPGVMPLLFSWVCAAAWLGTSSRLPASLLVNVTARAWLVAGLLSSAIGLCQYFGVEARGLPWVNQADAGQAFANLRQRNQFASLTSLALAALVWLAMTALPTHGANSRATRLRQWPMLLAAGLLAVGNAASSSRTGLMQLFMLGALFWCWGGWRQPLVRRVLLSAGMAYLLASLLLPGLAGLDPAFHGMFARLRTGDQACASRLTLWSNVLHLIGQKPWLGWGWGELDYAHYTTLYEGPRFCDILDNAHNLPLQLAVELGIPAALLMCGGFVWWSWRQRPWREVDSARQLAWAVLAVIGLHSLLEYPLWYGPFQMAAVLCVGFLWRSRASAAGNPEHESKRSSDAIASTLAAIILIAFCGYAGWDYQRISQIYRAPEARDAAYRVDTLAKINGSWLFGSQLRFAELSITPLTPANAEWTYITAAALLHYSPEPRVIEKVVESAVLLGRDDEALAHLARYRAAFPEEQARWARSNAELTQKLQRLN